MFLLRFLIQAFFLIFFSIDLDFLFQILEQGFSLDSFRMADPMTRDSGRGLDDDADDEQIGGPGNPPPKPWYQRISPAAWATGILLITLGIAIIIGNIQDPPPPINPMEGVRPPLAGGSANAGDSGPTNNGDSGGDAGD